MENTSFSSHSSQLQVSYQEKIVVATIIILLAITGIIGNSMIILAVAFSRKLQTATNAFVTSLAVTDLLSSFFFIWFAVGVFGKNEWPIPGTSWICSLTAFMLHVCAGTSLYTLGAIAVNRLVFILKPFLYHKIFSKWKLCVFVALPWILPSVFLIIFLLTGNGKLGYDKQNLSCSDIDNYAKGHVFNIGQIVFGLPIPILMIVGSYLWLYIYLRRHFEIQKQRVLRLPTVSYRTSDCNSFSTSLDALSSKPAASVTMQDISVAIATSQKKQISQKQLEITKNLFLVVCAFFVCFLPYFVAVAVDLSTDLNKIVFYCQLSPFANSALNFAIYARKHPDFKVVLGCMMRCSYADIPKPSRLLKLLVKKR